MPHIKTTLFALSAECTKLKTTLFALSAVIWSQHLSSMPKFDLTCQVSYTALASPPELMFEATQFLSHLSGSVGLKIRVERFASLHATEAAICWIWATTGKRETTNSCTPRERFGRNWQSEANPQRSLCQSVRPKDGPMYTSILPAKDKADRSPNAHSGRVHVPRMGPRIRALWP